MSWRNYQEEAAAFFRRLGMNAEVDKRQMQGAREKNDVDVWVTFSSMGIDHKWVVECKEWKNPIPKGEIQKLRDIVKNLGADKGIFLAENGYQSGAYEAARNTSLLLTSLKELRERGEAGFLEEWAKGTTLRLNQVRSHSIRERRKLERRNPTRQVAREQWGELEMLDYMVEQLDYLGEGIKLARQGEFNEPIYLGYKFAATWDPEKGLLVEGAEAKPVIEKYPLHTMDLISVISYCDMTFERYERWLNEDRSFMP